MKQNHESFLDKTSFNDNEFAKPTSMEKEAEPTHEKPLPKLPKRKFEMGSHQLFYLLHVPVLLVMAAAGIIGQVIPLLLAIVPYGAMLYVMRRVGSSLNGKGMDYVLWNLSVLVSTYTNHEMPNLRRFGLQLRVSGAVVAVLFSLFSAWFMLFGLLTLGVGLVFAFAEKDGKSISKVSQITAFGLLATGVIGLFLAPGLALATLSLSLCFHHLYEKWDEYEFELDSN